MYLQGVIYLKILGEFRCGRDDKCHLNIHFLTTAYSSNLLNITRLALLKFTNAVIKIIFTSKSVSALIIHPSSASLPLQGSLLRLAFPDIQTGD